MKNFFTLLAVLIILHSPLLIADVSGKIIAYNCYSCHGEQLTNLYPSKKISKVQLTQILMDFKYDKKESTIMNRISKGFSDNELESAATFLTTVEN